MHGGIDAWKRRTTEDWKIGRLAVTTAVEMLNA